MFIKMCDACNKPTKPLVAAKVNPKASEWYCEECHLSHQMSNEEYLQVVNSFQGKG